MGHGTSEKPPRHESRQMGRSRSFFSFLNLAKFLYFYTNSIGNKSWILMKNPAIFRELISEYIYEY